MAIVGGGVNGRASGDLLTTAASLDAVGGDDWRIIRGDCLDILPRLPDRCADLIFADPPYNLQLKGELYRPNMTRVNGVEDEWDKFPSFAAYDNFCRQWLGECRRLLKDNGTMWVIGTYHNIGRLGVLMQDLGFWLLNDVVWQKTNPMPNFRGVRFTNATETLLWAKKSEKGKYTFNHRQMKAENGGKQMTNVWTFPLCNGKERLRNEDGKKLHSTQKPAALLRRVILSSTQVGGMVLDPFLGSGTTMAVARSLGRDSVGIEREARYVSVAVERVQAITQEEFLPVEEEKKPRRVLFEEIVHSGLLRAGQKIYTKDGVSADVLKNGAIKLNGHVGSIHRVGAIIAQTPSCNGWKFWFLKSRAGERISINALREKVRGEVI